MIGLVGFEQDDWIGGIGSQRLGWWDWITIIGLVRFEQDDWIGVI
jgi:hypothetical protein